MERMDIKAEEQETKLSEEDTEEETTPEQDTTVEDMPQDNSTEMAEEQSPGMIFE